MTRVRVRTTAVAAAALAIAALASACGGDSGGDAPSSALATAMDRVSGSGPARTYFEFGDFAALRKAGIVHADQLHSGGRPIEPRWNLVAGVGANTLTSYTFPLDSAVGLNLVAADTATTIGTPPNSAVRLDGSFDAKTITGKLTGLGAKSRTFDGTKGLSFAADNRINQSGKLYRALMLVNQLNQVLVTKDTVIASPNAATLERAHGKGTSLLGTGPYRQLADCLGDVAAAIIEPPGSKAAGGKDKRVAVFAVGVRTPTSSGGTVHEVACAAPTEGETNEVRAAFTVHLRPSGYNPVTNTTLSSDVAKSTVSTRGKLVRAELTLRGTQSAGVLIAGLERGLAPYWDGSCTAVDVAQKHCG